jgi:hypothetical protein
MTVKNYVTDVQCRARDCAVSCHSDWLIPIVIGSEDFLNVVL